MARRNRKTNGERSKIWQRLSQDEYLRAISESSPSHVMLLDPEGRIQFINRTVEDLTEEEVMGTPIQKWVPEEFRQRIIDCLARVVASRKPDRYETAYKNKSGETQWFETQVAPVVTDGEVTALSAVSTEVTHLRRTEEASRQHESRYVGLLKAVPDLIFRIGGEGTILEFVSGENMPTYVPPPDFLGKRIQDVLPEEVSREIVDAVDTSLRTRSIQTIEYELDMDGEGRHYEARIVPVADDEILAIARDVTDRKRSETALLQSEQRWRSIAENSAEIVLVLDPDGTVQYINRTLILPVEAVVGTSVYSHMLPSESENLARCCEGVLASGEPGTYQNRLENDRGVYYFEGRVSPIVRDGSVVSLVVAATDITARKLAEEALAKRADQHRVVARLGEHALSGMAISDLTEAIVAAVADTLDVEFSKVLRLMPDGKSLLLEAGRGWKKGLVGKKTVDTDKKSQAGFTILSDTPVIVDDLSKEKRFSAPPLLSDHGVVSGVSVVIRGANGPYGVLGAHTSRQRKFDEDDANFVQSVANVLALTFERYQFDDALRRSEATMAALLSNLPGYAYRCANDRDWTLDFISEGVLEITGYSQDEYLVQRSITCAEKIHVDDRDRVWDEVQASLEKGEPFDVTYRIATKSGEERWLQEQGRAINTQDGGIDHIDGFVTDITDRIAAELRLRESDERFRHVLLSAPDGVVAVDGDGRIALVNDRAEEMFGYSKRELVGQPIELLLPAEGGKEHADQRLKYLKRPRRREMSARSDLSARRKDGSVFPVDVTLSPTKLPDGLAVVASVRDATNRKKAEETVRHMAYHDSLTGLPNRELVKDRLNLALAQAHRSHQNLAVIYMDIDRFKTINDTLGHTVGDKLLRGVARELSRAVREGDTVARVGGDEFLILLPEISGARDVISVAERVLERIGRRRRLAGQELLVTLSLGISLYPSDADNAEELLTFADTAMYRAKEWGKSQYQFYRSEMTSQIGKRLVMEAELRQALENDEIVMYFQPQLDVETGRLLGAEALARWHHPNRGIVLPDDFVQVAEEAGLSALLTKVALRAASRLHEDMNKKGFPPIRVAVNLGPAELRRRDLPQVIARALADTETRPEYLQVEITEREAMQDPDLALEVLTELKSLGVQIIVDDFGTGHASLNYLRRFPVDGVKVDRSFVRGVDGNEEDAAIVSAIISMAKSLNLSVIAEGVETEGQLEFLKDRGCDEYQGFLFSPAVPADEFEKLLKAQPM